MTPIGHTLTGLAIGTLAIPRETPLKQKAIALGVYAILASAPDLPLPYWGHARYDISHSLFATTVAVLVTGLLALWRFKGRPPCTLVMIFAGAVAWFSHIVLDAMYSWGVGLPIGWPFGMLRLALPVPWLHPGNKYNVLSLFNVKVALYEILTFGPLLLIALGIKYYWPRSLRFGSKAIVPAEIGGRER